MTDALLTKSTATKRADSHSAPLLRIMYTSVTHSSWGDQGLDSLLAQCVKNNVRSDITGVLMVDGLLNIQYIEGPEQVVRGLWQRISIDKRHHLIVQLYEEEGELPRLFGQWAMLRGQTSRAEMLSLIRNAYLESDASPRPVWSLAIAPLIILLDSNYSQAYARAVL